jgi:hypothetical protein
MKMDESKQSAQIFAKMHDSGDVEIHLDGRGFDLLSLSLSIARQMILRGLIDVDDFCDVLRAGTPSDDEIEKSIKKIINDAFLN